MIEAGVQLSTRLTRVIIENDPHRLLHQPANQQAQLCRRIALADRQMQ